MENNRWKNDTKCTGPFPDDYSKVEKTLKDIRKEKYDSSPNSLSEIKTAFENPVILKDLGTSLHYQHGQMFNTVHEEADFGFCIFPSPKSVNLIEEQVDLNERFFLIDGTFKITPMCNIFKQVLIIHAQFGIKVCTINCMYFRMLYSLSSHWLTQ